MINLLTGIIIGFVIGVFAATLQAFTQIREYKIREDQKKTVFVYNRYEEEVTQVKAVGFQDGHTDVWQDGQEAK